METLTSLEKSGGRKISPIKKWEKQLLRLYIKG